MIIDLLTLEKSPFDFEAAFDANEIKLESETVELKNEVKVRGTLTKRIMQADIEGEILAETVTECSRCLLKIEQELNFPFKASFVEPENYPQAKETELDAEDLDVSIQEENSIDLKELVREQILLNLPEHIYCREDCKGLCEKCGANRNLIDCNCEEQEIDPRWAALKDIK